MQYEKWKIHTVFPHFSYFRLAQNLSPSALADFIRASLVIRIADYGIINCGEETLWGQGLGESAIRAALAKAFLKWRAEKIIAKIVPNNQRSIRSVCSCGFQKDGVDGKLLRYRLTMDAAYLQSLRSQARKRS